jgi:hypothetical protein
LDLANAFLGQPQIASHLFERPGLVVLVVHKVASADDELLPGGQERCIILEELV